MPAMLSASFTVSLIGDPVVWMLVVLGIWAEVSVVLWLLRRAPSCPSDLGVWMVLIQALTWIGLLTFVDWLSQNSKQLSAVGGAAVASMVVVLEFALLRLIYRGLGVNMRFNSVAVAVVVGNVTSFALVVGVGASIAWLVG